MGGLSPATAALFLCSLLLRTGLAPRGGSARPCCVHADGTPCEVSFVESHTPKADALRGQSPPVLTPRFLSVGKTPSSRWSDVV